MKQYDIELISELMIDSITDLLDSFDIKYDDSQRTIVFQCPIHDGDSTTSSSILKRDVGNWKCYTHQCHEEYGTSNGASIIQFTQALLTTQYNKKHSFVQALEWCANFVGENTISYTTEDNNRINFIKLCKYINRKQTIAPAYTPRKLVRDFLAIPSAYYMKRGYSKDILEKFDVGYCHNQKRAFFDRVVTPFYDDSGKYMVGGSGRSRYEQCDQCKLYHAPTVRCPINKEERKKCYKWKHSSLFNADDYLYNYWNAQDHIKNSNTVILVEGPGDVWRLEEAGIHNSVALLKSTLSPGQKLILEMSGAINIIIATDMDNAGHKGAKSIIKECKNMFNTTRITYNASDPGGLTITEVQEIFGEKYGT